MYIQKKDRENAKALSEMTFSCDAWVWHKVLTENTYADLGQINTVHIRVCLYD